FSDTIYSSLFRLLPRPPPRPPLFPYTTLFRSVDPDHLLIARQDACFYSGRNAAVFNYAGCVDAAVGEKLPQAVSIAIGSDTANRSEEHTSELQSPYDLVCRLLLEKKKENKRDR